jgi:hypothetical protein
MKVSRTVLTGGMAETYRKVTRPVPTHSACQTFPLEYNLLSEGLW